jgi:putative MATE family efflux protein
MDTPSSLVSTAEPLKLWPALRDSLRGKAHDYTSGSIGRAILLLSIPMVLEMMMESLFGIVDIFFVGHLGRVATSTVALTESLLTMVFAVALGLSMATTATVARRIGEQNEEGAAIAAVQSIVLGLITSAIFGIAGVVFAPRLLALMGAAPAVIAAGHIYTAVMLGGCGVIFMLFLINAIFRGAGDPALAMRVLWIANAINIVLDPCLILGLGPFPKLGVTGAAISTTIGRGVGVALQFWFLSRGTGRIKIRRDLLKLDFPVIGRMLRIALNGMFQYLISTASWLALVRLMARFGTAALAGNTIAIRIVIFAILPSWGMSNAAATLVGQNLGAKRPDRAERSVWQTGLYNMMFLGGVALVFVLFAKPIVGIFSNDPAVVEYGATGLRIMSYGYIFYAWGMVLEQSFNGAGDTATPTRINLFCYWVLQIPLAYVLSTRTNMGPSGIFAAIPIAESVLAVVCLLAFRRGRWKNQKV